MPGTARSWNARGEGDALREATPIARAHRCRKSKKVTVVRTAWLGAPVGVALLPLGGEAGLDTFGVFRVLGGRGRFQAGCLRLRPPLVKLSRQFAARKNRAGQPWGSPARVSARAGGAPARPVCLWVEAKLYRRKATVWKPTGLRSRLAPVGAGAPTLPPPLSPPCWPPSPPPQAGAQQAGAQQSWQPRQRRARRPRQPWHRSPRQRRPRQSWQAESQAQPPSQAQAAWQPWQPWPATAVFPSPPNRARPTTAKKIAMPNTNARFIPHSSKNRYRTGKGIPCCRPLLFPHLGRRPDGGEVQPPILAALLGLAAPEMLASSDCTSSARSRCLGCLSYHCRFRCQAATG